MLQDFDVEHFNFAETTVLISLDERLVVVEREPGHDLTLLVLPCHLVEPDSFMGSLLRQILVSRVCKRLRQLLLLRQDQQNVLLHFLFFVIEALLEDLLDLGFSKD